MKHHNGTKTTRLASSRLSLSRHRNQASNIDSDLDHPKWILSSSLNIIRCQSSFPGHNFLCEFNSLFLVIFCQFRGRFPLPVNETARLLYNCMGHRTFWYWRILFSAEVDKLLFSYFFYSFMIVLLCRFVTFGGRPNDFLLP